MGKKTKSARVQRRENLLRKVEILVDYLKPLANIFAVDIGVRSVMNSKEKGIGISYMVGRLTSAANKRLLIKPYEPVTGRDTYVDLRKTDIEALEVRTIRRHTGFSSSSTVGLEEYDKLMMFRGDNIKIVGRFLRALAGLVDNGRLGTSTESRPENTIRAAISACALIGGSPRWSKKGVGSKAAKKKEFFFKEKLGEVSDEKKP